MANEEAEGPGMVAVIVTAGLVLLAAGTCFKMFSGSDAPSAPAVQELNASVRKNALQVEVTNLSSQAWTNCRVDLNPGIIRGGWTQRIANIPAGQMVAGGIMAFTKPDGERFNPAEYAIQSVSVNCDEGFWSGSFGP